jgi:hypothetical protein
MTITKLLEEIANNTHHLAIETLTKNFPSEVRTAIASKNSSQLRSLFVDKVEVVANRSSIVQVTSD